jgi:hypothetical protein
MTDSQVTSFIFSIFSLVLSIVLAGVGLYMSYKSGVTLTRIEEQNKKFDDTMNLFVDRLVRAQIDLLLAQKGVSPSEGDITKRIEQLRGEFSQKRE